MYRISIEKSTGKLIEMQSGGYDDEKLRNARLDTLRQNAINAGYDEKDIEVKWITDKEWATIEETLNRPTPEQIAAQEREALIQKKMREMAEAELVKEGKLEAR
ncbi:MAG: hypothetical protein PHQ43_01775 [Dehalococcoidales bacterium]|nr:hypothetical protein [Dehalococcoidales bacterium]